LAAIESIDESISLCQSTGQNFWLVRAYPHGVRMHEPFVPDRSESVAKTLEYATKAAQLLTAYGKPDEAAHFEEFARKLREGPERAE